jgi:hypothetical protein
MKVALAASVNRVESAAKPSIFALLESNAVEAMEVTAVFGTGKLHATIDWWARFSFRRQASQEP